MAKLMAGGRPKKDKELKKLQGTWRRDRDGDKPARKRERNAIDDPPLIEDHSGTFQAYIDGVMDGSIQAGELIKLTVQRHLNDLSRIGDDDFPYVFDIERAEEHIRFAEICRHWKGDKARHRFVLEPHQVFQWISLYGWYHTETDIRRFHRAMKLVARKNYKTTEAAIMALDHLVVDPPEGPQIYAGSMKHDQSIILVNDAGMIAQRTKEIADYFEVFKYRGMIQRVVSQEVSGFFAPLSKENENSSQDGLDPSFGIIDEYHAHPDDRVVNILESGYGNRPDWFQFIISTAGANKYGPCYSVSRKTGINILRGIQHDDQAFFMFHEMDEGDDWHDEAAWGKANPRMLSDPHFIEYLRTRYTIAKNQGGEKESDFKTKNLNMWIDQYNAWIPDDAWMSQKPGLDADDLYGRPCYGGLDLASTRDFNAFVLVFPREDDFIDVLCWFWLPGDMLDNRVERITSDFNTWVKSGYIKKTYGNTVDYDVILNDIRELSRKYDIKSIAYDRKFSAPIVTGLESDVKMNAFDQSIGGMSYPTKKLDVLVGQRKVNHYNNPVLRWMMGNVSIYRDANDNIKIVKHKSTDAVDGPVALVMAIGEWETFKNVKQSIYATRGVIDI